MANASDSLTRIRSGQSWAEFCDSLKSAGAFILKPDAPDTGLDKAEGFRCLSRFARLALEMMVEFADPDFPVFYAASHDTIKVFLPNPDNIYANATVMGDRDYVIRGNRGSVPYFSFGTKANRFAIDGTMASTGELEAEEMAFSPNGDFEVHLSATKKPGNWLPMAADTSMVLVRQTFLDRANEIPAQFTIARTQGPKAPVPLSAETLDKNLARAAAFVRGTAKTVTDWTDWVAKAPNSLAYEPYAEASMRAGGDPKICYLHGYWQLQPDEGLLIETEVPECPYWNFQLANYWLESLDTLRRPVWINKHGAKLNRDGSLTMVVAAKDMGIGNFLDTDSHDRGGMLLRWVGAKHFPVPRCRVVKLTRLAEEVRATG